MRLLQCMGAALIASILAVGSAAARVDIRIDLSTQTMRVSDGVETFVWPVSTARAGYVTPRGVYRPIRLELMHYSRKYEMSPMPHSIFFKGGYAIHGTYETRSLGRPASHGCVRISPAHAALLFKMVRAEGARISISGQPPRGLGSRLRRPPQAAPYSIERSYGFAPAPYFTPQWRSDELW